MHDPQAIPEADDNAAFVLRMELGGDGLRVGVKDSIDIAGYPTRAGSAAMASAPPALRHAAVVQALLDRGCRIVGKTNMHELAYGVTGINRWSGTPRNPRYPDRIPGGSSSGSAVAVAAGAHADFTLGTDTGGSIRIPAACCGVYGLKTSYGRISREGVHPAVSSLDCVGPFARSLAMIERAMALMDASYAPGAPAANIRLGIVNVTADPGVVATVRAALARADIASTPIDLPSLEDAYAAGLTIIGAENWSAYGHLVDGPGLGDDVRTRLLGNRSISGEALAAAERCRTIFRAEVDAALERADALVLPTLPIVPPRLGEIADARAVLRLTAFVRPFNVSGHPALSIPLATEANLPAGLQLVGRRGGDAALCAAAHRLVPRSAETNPGS
ncbi:MAG TPA: amidase [Steroidobacteraceae bacterium]|nr:amidase [Steroidobacteraceae bacterium]